MPQELEDEDQLERREEDRLGGNDHERVRGDYQVEDGEGAEAVEEPPPDPVPELDVAAEPGADPGPGATSAMQPHGREPGVRAR